MITKGDRHDTELYIPITLLLGLVMLSVPALVIGYLNPQFLHSRVIELINAGFGPIYVFVDGCDDHTKSWQNLECRAVAEKLRHEKSVVEILLPERNLGQGIGIPSAINWFFNHQDFGLILEDDCQISPSFHSYVLENSWRILDAEHGAATLCGSNIFGITSSESVFASPLFESWGWATSRTNWLKFYCENLQELDIGTAVANIGHLPPVLSKRLIRSWTAESERISNGIQNTWALRLTLGIIAANSHCIYPSVNQVKHLSHVDAVHVKSTPRWYRNISLGIYRQSESKAPAIISRKHISLTLRHMYGVAYFRFLWRIRSLFG